MVGSIIYLYLVYSWYSGGAASGAWLAAAQFFAPFVAAFAVIASVSLFFMALGRLAGMKGGDDEKMGKVLWKFVMIGALSLLIVTGGSGMFAWAVLGFVLTYIGAAALKM